MHAFFIFWAATFVALLVAIPITAIIYGMMGDGLELNGWVAEIVIALVVSAGQASGLLLHHVFANPWSAGPAAHGNSKVVATVFALSFWLGYQITHLTTWDWLEYLILGLVDAVLAFGALLLVARWVAA